MGTCWCLCHKLQHRLDSPETSFRRPWWILRIIPLLPAPNQQHTPTTFDLGKVFVGAEQPLWACSCPAHINPRRDLVVLSLSPKSSSSLDKIDPTATPWIPTIRPCPFISTRLVSYHHSSGSLARCCRCLSCSLNVSPTMRQSAAGERVTDPHQMPRASWRSPRVVSPSLNLIQMLALAIPSIADVNLPRPLATSNAPRCLLLISLRLQPHIYLAFHLLPVRDMTTMYRYFRASIRKMQRHNTSVRWQII